MYTRTIIANTGPVHFKLGKISRDSIVRVSYVVNIYWSTVWISLLGDIYITSPEVVTCWLWMDFMLFKCRLVSVARHHSFMENRLELEVGPTYSVQEWLEGRQHTSILHDRPSHSPHMLGQIFFLNAFWSNFLSQVHIGQCVRRERRPSSSRIMMMGLF